MEKQQTEGGFECMHIVLVCVALCMRVSVEEVVFTENLNSPFVFFSLPCVQLSFFSVSSHSSYRLSSVFHSTPPLFCDSCLLTLEKQQTLLSMPLVFSV